MDSAVVEKPKAKNPYMKLRAALGELASRSWFARAAGKTFEGSRDVHEALGYALEISAKDYNDRYERGGIAARIVEAYPDATWRGEAELIEDETKSEQTEFEKAWEELDTRLNVWLTFNKADTLCGIGRYSIIVLGLPGQFESPAKGPFKPEDLKYLSIFREDDAKIAEFDENYQSPRYGRPVYYNVKSSIPADLTASKKEQQPRKVHFSRVIHIADNLLDNNVFGQPRLKNVWNLLDDLIKVIGGGSEAFWIRSQPGLNVNVDPDVDFTDEDAEELEEEVDKYMHKLRRVIQTRGAEVKTLTADVAQFGPNATAIVEQISATKGIPQRILMGSERGELASTQDKTSWDERVNDRRKKFADPVAVRPFVDRCIEFGILPKPAKYFTRWPDFEKLSLAQKAVIVEKLAKTNSLAQDVIITPDEIRDHVFGWLPVSEEDRKKFMPEPNVSPLGRGEAESNV